MTVMMMMMTMAPRALSTCIKLCINLNSGDGDELDIYYDEVSACLSRKMITSYKPELSARGAK